MALDLTLCLVPKQIDTLFSKAAGNTAYAEWIQAIPSLLKDPQNNDYQDAGLIQLKHDVAALKGLYHFTDAHYFYDSSRDSYTLDYLLNAHILATNQSISPSLLWEGGTAYPALKAVQGVPISLYGEAAVVEAFDLLADLEFSELLVHYNHEKMQELGVYKLTRPDNLAMLELAFYEIQDLFSLALAEDLLVFKKLD